MASNYNRYSNFSANGEMRLVPFAEIPVKSSDRYEYYIAGRTRLDILSYTHYKDANYGWLILQANPDVGGLEFNIKDGTLLRIPYPLSTSLTDYENSIKRYNELYGID